MNGLFGSALLDVGIGLVFMYWLISLIVSVLNELIARAVALRAKTLEQGLRRMLTGQERPPATPPARDFVQELYDHAFIRGLTPVSGARKPSYIDARQFALALLDIVAPGIDPAAPDYWKQVHDEVDKITEPHLKQALTGLLDHTQNDVASLRTAIENWFNDTMDRVSGWYKRKVEVIVLCLGLIVTCLLNADTLGVAQALWSSPTARAGAVDAAQAYVTKNPPPDTTSFKTIAGSLDELTAAKMPIGWNVRPVTPADYARDIFGLILTTLAISVGAPFWFDVLSKLLSLGSTGRSTGPPPTGSGASTVAA